MGLFDRLNEPVFLKEDSVAPIQLTALEELRKTVSEETGKKLDREIRNVRAGMAGENQIAFELKNSHMPMYVLHDLYLEHEGLTAQIDYLVVTRRRYFIIECKNLYGNIEITEQGDFIRNIGYNGKTFQERIYSPITQNERHLALIKQICCERKSNFLTKAIFLKFFPELFWPVVVLANSKTILNMEKAPSEIKEKVIFADQLISYIRKANTRGGVDDCSDKEMTSDANFYLDLHKGSPDYSDYYRSLFKIEKPKPVPLPIPKLPLTPSSSPSPTSVLCPRCGASMVLHTAKKGSFAGQEFYGCSRYPQCRAIVNLK